MAKEVSPEDWYFARIESAQTIEDLRDVALNIDYDKWEEEEYTKNEELMRSLRTAWAAKKKELES